MRLAPARVPAEPHEDGQVAVEPDAHASADHGHAHTPEGIYGYHPAAGQYDAKLQEILASERLDFLPLAELVEDAKADSLWQLLVLQGAVGEEAQADVLAYAAPTYYGMLVADIEF